MPDVARAGLRDNGYVTSEKGHGGGWKLARPLDQMTLLDVYVALGNPPVFALGLADDDPRCLVEQAVNDGLNEALGKARQLLLDRFGKVTLADLAADFRKRFVAANRRRCRRSKAGDWNLRDGSRRKSIRLLRG